MNITEEHATPRQHHTIAVNGPDPKRNRADAGNRFRAYLYHCAACPAVETVYARHLHLTAAEADALVRDYDWSQHGRRWYCRLHR